jgi:hypothetical protein
MLGSVSLLSSEYRLGLINWFSLRLGDEMCDKGSGLAIVTGPFPEIRISYHPKTVLEDRLAKAIVVSLLSGRKAWPSVFVFSFSSPACVEKVRGCRRGGLRLAFGHQRLLT